MVFLFMMGNIAHAAPPTTAHLLRMRIKYWGYMCDDNIATLIEAG
jgi:hypothetical protein